jgi:cell fate regulator YaaT (PSP1 superfamily)
MHTVLFFLHHMSIYIIDWLINKPVLLTGTIPPEVTYGKKVIYLDEEKKQQLWVVVWYEIETTKKWTFLHLVEGSIEEQWNQNHKKALELFDIFKKDFNKSFPESVPVTARMNLQWWIVYFYFFAEVRFQFAEFVKVFRQKIGYNFFLYQVWARDRIRLDPRADGMYCASGHGTGLDCKTFKHPMPNVESDAIMLQQLEWRDIEKLKWLCGKLKCSLNYEKDYYEQETKKYPSRWTYFTIQGDKVKCLWFNVMTEEIKIRNENTEQISKISLNEYIKTLSSSKPTVQW